MRKKILLFLILSSFVLCGDIIIRGQVKVSSIVGFDKAEVTGTAYVSDSNTFINSNDIEVDAILGAKFSIIKKDLFVKANTSDGIEIQLTASTSYGDLVDGRDRISLDYRIMNTLVDFTSNSWIVIPTTVNNVDTLTDAFQVIQRSNTASDQRAGTYSTTLTFNVRARL